MTIIKLQKCTKCGSEFEDEYFKTDGLEYEQYICSNKKCCAVHQINIDRDTESEEYGCPEIDRDWNTLEFSYIWEQGFKKDEPKDFTGHCPECNSNNLDNVSGGVDSTEMYCYDCKYKFGIESKGWVIS